MTKKLFNVFANTSLRFKIGLLVLMVGILPSGLILIISLGSIEKLYSKQQAYSLNQGFEQVLLSVKDKMDALHNISTLLAVSDIYETGTVFAKGDNDIAGQLSDFNRINSYAYGMEFAFDSCTVTYYINDDFSIVNNVSSRFHSISEIESEEWYKMLDDSSTALWTLIGGRLSIARNLYSSEDYSRKVGLIVIGIDMASIQEILIGSEKGQIMCLSDSRGNVLVSNSSDFDNALEKEKLSFDSIEETSGFLKGNIDGINYLTRRSRIGDTGIYLLSVVPEDYLDKERNKVIMQTLLLYIGVGIAILLVLTPFTRLITGRIRTIGNTMEQMKDGSLKKIEENSSRRDEISLLIHKYNDMVDTVEESLKEQYALGEAKKDAELKALQSQINPHFLYNTLDMISWMAQKNEKENIREVIQSMSRFYRMTLSKGADIITIRDELSMCEAYMDIQKMRFKGKINFKQQVDEEVYDYLIPKITLQPLIENAIVHGINEKEDPRGTIKVDGFVEDGIITLSVTDDGVGVKSDSKVSSNSSHYGMKNIRKRLEVFFGERVSLNLESTAGIGTCVIVEFPAQKGESVEEK
ncbi:MAG: sensor histidine kinase [Butyrivibrio sp.]|nr:sensor histidine kinase [Butyrivibrio sp.]